MINSFEKKALFGTDGIRAAIGTMPFSGESFRALSNAIARWIVTTYGEHASILICHDPRQSAHLLSMNFIGQLLQYPIAIHDAGELPTPAAHLLIKKTTFNCSIIVSASHNGYQDNGIKIIDAITDKIGPEHERFISEQYIHFLTNPEVIPFQPRGSYIQYTTAAEDYIKLLQSKISIQKYIPHRIVIDSGNGACSSLAEKVFKCFEIDVIHINNNPSGTNINDNCGATKPQSMIDAVIKESAFLGFSFDGDGDRMVMADATGRLYTGDEILALLSEHPRYSQEKSIVGTLMSNLGFEQWLAGQGKQLIRAQVGDKHVLGEMRHHNALLGGEPSGHIILKDHLSSSDGIFTALLITGFMATRSTGIEYQRFPQKIYNLPTQKPIDITSSSIQAIIKHAYILLGNGRIVLRNSGTEPCLRIMVEGSQNDPLETTVAYLAHEIKNNIGKETSL